MITQRQKQAARRNIKKAQEVWKGMSSRQHAIAHRARAKPGTVGTGRFYRVVIRPESDFVTFRNHDVGRRGGIERVAGKRPSGSWDTTAWLFSKYTAHIENGKLVPDSRAVAKVLDTLGSTPVHVKGDVFRAKPRPNVPEKDKPTQAQQKARKENIKKALTARSRK